MTDITKRANSTTIHDEKAEALEAKGFYRRAATRWAEVMMLVKGDKERAKIAQRRAECIRKAARPRVLLDDYGSLKKAVDRVHANMGLRKPHGGSFRNYPNQ
ncbi:PerC family transcriptional regulator [Escherichia coli]|uniref:PerC family transcriptional regulator n=1 Tax=Escherichia coli TaxID=562 RepID=UPI00135D7D80|nr:PerC family transcriptional regulator [Escherichia coli]MXF07405.1 PerC family transcriptional regulator [Escherichia coli]